MPITPPKINVGPDGLKPWLQKGLRYGVGDAGAFQSFSYRGPRDEIEDLAPNFNVEGWTFEVTREPGGLARLDVHAGWNLGTNYTAEEPENVWEIEGNEVEKNLLECDFGDGSGKLGLVSKANKAVIADALNRPQDFTTSNPTFSGATAGAALSLYLLMKNGVTSYPIEASVFSHTQIVSNRYALKASFINCKRIISTASLPSLENVPDDLLWDVPPPPTVTQYIETPESSPGAQDGDLQYGWRKDRPHVTRLARNKWRIVQKYQFGLWAVKAYGPVL